MSKRIHRFKTGAEGISSVIRRCTFILAGTIMLSACDNTTIVKKPVTFDEERTQLSFQYLKERHGIDTDQINIDPKMIVIHYTVIPTLEGTMRAFESATLPSARAGIASASSLNVSSQFVIDRDGTIYQILPEETTFARHVIGLNYAAIGVENVGDDETNPLTEAQLKANIKLIRYLKGKYQDIEYLIGHQEYNSFRDHPLWTETDPGYRTEKTDPGIQFMVDIRDQVVDLDLKGPPIDPTQ
jgi:N-acetyl-anhydromuramyl-L-alanine amidase AmpD